MTFTYEYHKISKPKLKILVTNPINSQITFQVQIMSRHKFSRFFAERKKIQLYPDISLLIHKG